jgi:hypothetical protein
MLLRLAVLTVFAAVAQGCAGDFTREAAPRAEVCSPRLEGEPCAVARAGVEYPAAILSHCGVEWAYFDGRYWLADPRQSEGANELHGVMSFVDGETRVRFDVEDGRRYEFEPAPTSYEPPLCY